MNPDAGTDGPGGLDGYSPPPLDPDIGVIVGGIDGARQLADLNRLIGFYNRNICSSTTSATQGIGATRNWIRDQFLAIGGNVMVTFDTFSTTACGAATTQRNVIAWIPGASSTRLVVIGGHYDNRSVGATDGTAEAPGANDSGSQTALVLEAARAMANRSYQATVVFAAFAAEEQGLFGSINFVANLGSYFPGGRVEATLVADIVGGDASVNSPTQLQQFRLFSPGTPREASATAQVGFTDDTSPSRGVMRYIGKWGAAYVPEMTMLPNLREDRPGRGSDHQSFLDAGFPGVRFIDVVEDAANQHNNTDTVGNMTPAYMTRITKVIVATAANLAFAPPPPPSLTVTSGGGGIVNLVWTAPASGVVDHYVVAARTTTENFYRRRVFAGGSTSTSASVTTADLDVAGAAAFFISVSAVSAKGHESLFAYPEYRCTASSCVVQPDSLDVTRKI